MERNIDPPDGTHAQGADLLRAAWKRLPVLPVLRVPDAGEATSGALALADAGLGAVELTATTPGWEKALEEVATARADLLVGLGTVRDAATARRALECGATFVVTPYVVADVVDAVAGRVPVIQGGWTPGEVAAAIAPTGGLGKLFPAQVGGPAHLAGLLAVLPEAELVPTGGVSLDDVEEWLDAGALAVGVGSALVRQLAEDPDGVTRRLDELRRSR